MKLLQIRHDVPLCSFLQRKVQSNTFIQYPTAVSSLSGLKFKISYLTRFGQISYKIKVIHPKIILSHFLVKNIFMSPNKVSEN